MSTARTAYPRGIDRSKIDTRDVADLWRYGERFEWSPVFDDWVGTNRFETVRPGETVRFRENGKDCLILCK